MQAARRGDAPAPPILSAVALVPLYGHAELLAQFRDAYARGALPASLLLEGPRGVGKQRLAIALARMLLCAAGPTQAPCEQCQQCRFSRELTHPDLLWIFPRERPKDPDPDPQQVRADYGAAVSERVESRGLYEPAAGMEGIFIATIRAIVAAAAVSPAIARRKVFIVGDAERMVSQEGSDQAANAFLKLLEEPPADTNIILTSSEPGALLPTIRSRVVAVRVPRIADSDVEQFLAAPAVSERLSQAGSNASTRELITFAAGAPGRLLALDAWRESLANAQRLLEAAEADDRAPAYKVALGQGSARARGSFSDMLDAMTVLLHARTQRAVRDGQAGRAFRAARAIALVEESKERVTFNANPQLVTAGLLRELSPLLQ